MAKRGKADKLKAKLTLPLLIILLIIYSQPSLAQNNHSKFQYKYYPSNESANFTVPGTAAFNLQELEEFLTEPP